MSGNLTKHDLLLRVAEAIGSDLAAADAIFAEELESWHPYVTDVMTHVTRFRGKRLRPMLLLLTAKACGDIRQEHRVLAAVVEMIHTATLVHDDVLDEADTRRHVATVNSRWNTETSVLSGDFLFTHAFHLAASLPSTLACRLIGRATNRVCEGELCQVHERANCELSEEQYFRIIDGKTAELCALCCFLGAHFADADEATATAMQDYGRSLGLAFQIADDLLDILGTENETGKSLGTDFKKQKLTLPIIRLRDTASTEQRARIMETLSNPTESGWQNLFGWLRESDAIEYARKEAESLVSSARQQLEVLEDSPARRILEELADFCCQRSY